MWRYPFRHVLFVSLSALALVACSEANNDNSSLESADYGGDAVAGELSVATPVEEESGELSALNDAPAIPVSMPKMAYVFDYGFRLPADNISALQQKHADLCEAQGPFTCQILSMSQSGEDEHVSGKLELAVAAGKARAFGAGLSGAASGLGGEQTSATIAGEDLSKRMVDTEAHLRSRIVLRDRLLEVLKTRNGKVSELVEAERSVARVNEEIDQARSWLEEMRGRVAFSRVNVNYESATPVAGSFMAPVEGAIASLGSILGTITAILIVLAAIGIPAVAVVLGIRNLRRRYMPEMAER